MTIAVGDHVTLVFPSTDPDTGEDVLTERSALVVSAPDPVAQDAAADDDDQPTNPALNLVTVDASSPHDRYGHRPSYWTNVPHEDDYKPDPTGSAGAPAPYYTN